MIPHLSCYKANPDLLHAQATTMGVTCYMPAGAHHYNRPAIDVHMLMEVCLPGCCLFSYICSSEGPGHEVSAPLHHAHELLSCFINVQLTVPQEPLLDVNVRHPCLTAAHTLLQLLQRLWESRA